MERAGGAEGTKFYRLVRLFWGPAVRRYFRVSCHGAAQVPARGPCIIAANHQSYLDPIVIGATSPRPVRFMMIRRYWDMPVVGWASRLAGSFPVDDGRVTGRTLRQALGLLRDGSVLGIFPEGAITRDGRLQPGREGVARLALRTGAPVVPAGITGTRRAFPKGRWIPRPLAVAVRYGAPLLPPGEAGDPAVLRRQAAEFTARIMERIAELAGDGSGSEPAPSA